MFWDKRKNPMCQRMRLIRYKRCPVISAMIAMNNLTSKQLLISVHILGIGIDHRALS